MTHDSCSNTAGSLAFLWRAARLLCSQGAEPDAPGTTRCFTLSDRRLGVGKRGRREPECCVGRPPPSSRGCCRVAASREQHLLRQPSSTFPRSAGRAAATRSPPAAASSLGVSPVCPLRISPPSIAMTTIWQAGGPRMKGLLSAWEGNLLFLWPAAFTTYVDCSEHIPGRCDLSASVLDATGSGAPCPTPAPAVPSTRPLSACLLPANDSISVCTCKLCISFTPGARRLRAVCSLCHHHGAGGGAGCRPDPHLLCHEEPHPQHHVSGGRRLSNWGGRTSRTQSCSGPTQRSNGCLRGRALGRAAAWLARRPAPRCPTCHALGAPPPHPPPPAQLRRFQPRALSGGRPLQARLHLLCADGRALHRGGGGALGGAQVPALHDGLQGRAGHGKPGGAADARDGISFVARPLHRLSSTLRRSA